MTVPPVQPGKRIRQGLTASAFNAFAGAANGHAQSQFTASTERRPAENLTDLVRVRNESGADRRQFDILGLAGTIIRAQSFPQSFAAKPALTGATPTAAHAGRFAVLAEPISVGKIGRAYISGCCPVRVNVTDLAHAWADVDPDDATRLTSGHGGGAQLLTNPTATGEQLLYVRLSNSGGSPFSAALYLNGSNQSITTGTYQVFDFSGGHATGSRASAADATTDIITVPVSGWYTLEYSMYLTSVAGGAISIQAFNGSTGLAATSIGSLGVPASNVPVTPSVSMPVELDAGDEVTLRAVATSGTISVAYPKLSLAL